MVNAGPSFSTFKLSADCLLPAADSLLLTSDAELSKKSFQFLSSAVLPGSMKCAWCFSVKPLKIEVDVAADFLSSVKGCCIEDNCWIDESRSKSRVGVTLN